jgi:hypothetical protein
LLVVLHTNVCAVYSGAGCSDKGFAWYATVFITRCSSSAQSFCMVVSLPLSQHDCDWLPEVRV